MMSTIFGCFCTDGIWYGRSTALASELGLTEDALYSVLCPYGQPTDYDDIEAFWADVDKHAEFYGIENDDVDADGWSADGLEQLLLPKLDGEKRILLEDIIQRLRALTAKQMPKTTQRITKEEHQ